MPPPIVTTSDGLLPLLRDKTLVFLDGVDSAGNSTLARWLAERLHGARVAADDYVDPPSGRDQRRLHYVDLLDRVSLGAAVRATLSRGPVVLDGICALDIAERIMLRPQAHVLVTRTDPRGARFDIAKDDYLRGRGTATVSEAALLDDRVTEEQLVAWLERRGQESKCIIPRSLAAYFKRFSPHHNADAVYLRS